MAIEDYFNTDFTIKKRTEHKVDGRNIMSYVTDSTIFRGAIFIPSTDRTIRFGSQDFIISKDLYCKVAVPLVLGDIVIVDGGEYDVISIIDTNNLTHHLAVGLASRD